MVMQLSQGDRSSGGGRMGVVDGAGGDGRRCIYVRTGG
jgi:hypothetical protein